MDLRIYVDHAPAIVPYEKFGFEIEGTYKPFANRDGAYVDTYVMAHLR